MRAKARATGREDRARGQFTLFLLAGILFASIALASHGAEHAIEHETTHVDCSWCEHLDRTSTGPQWPPASFANPNPPPHEWSGVIAFAAHVYLSPQPRAPPAQQ